MQTKEEASREHEQQFGFNSEGEINSSPSESFQAGINFAQKWLDIHKEEPKYYQPILADNGEYMGVVARVSDGDEDYYHICGTNIIMYPCPIKWRPIELK